MKKKGFTLVELVAVILVLGIILLIAVPLVTNLITNSQKSAYKETAMGVIRAFENELAENKYEKLPVIYEVNGNKISKLNSTVENEIDYDGKLESTGHIYMNGHESTAIFIQNEKYCAIKEFADKEAKVYKKGSKECDLGLQSSSKWYLEATDYQVEINSHFTIPTPVAKDNEGTDLDITWTITNVTQNKVVGENIWVIDTDQTTNLNDIFEVYYKAFDESINEERSTTATIKVVDTIKPSLSVDLNSNKTNYNNNVVKIEVNASDNGTKTENLKMYIGTNTEIDSTSDKWVVYKQDNTYTVSSSLDGKTNNIVVQIMDEAGNIETKKISYTTYKECVSTTIEYGEYPSGCPYCGGARKYRTNKYYDTITRTVCKTETESTSCYYSCPTTRRTTTPRVDMEDFAAGESAEIIEAPLP